MKMISFSKHKILQIHYLIISCNLTTLRPNAAITQGHAQADACKSDKSTYYKVPAFLNKCHKRSGFIQQPKVAITYTISVKSEAYHCLALQE